MGNLSLATQTVKDSVSALDVGQAIGLEIRRGRCQCPFHNGKDFNCVLYRGNRGWYCHVCKRGGDVLSFVQQYYSMTFKDCIEWFSATFHLDLGLDAPIDPAKEEAAKKALVMRKRRIEFEEWKKRMRFDLALTADEIVRQLEDERDMKRPKTYGEWDPDFCAAVVALPEARQFYEDMMMECTEVKDEL